MMSSAFLRDRDEAVDRALVAGCKLLGKRVADQRDRFVQPECRLRIAHVEDPAIALSLQPGAEIPEIEARVGFALLQFLKDQRRRAVLERRLALEIDALADRGRLDNQPALVERAAGDGENPALRSPIFRNGGCLSP